MDTAPIRIFLVEDHTIVREGLKEILNQRTEMQIVGEVGDAESYLVQSQNIKHDLVILDLSLPGTPGLKLLETLSKTLPVLVLTTHVEEHYAVRAFKAGASGFLCKSKAFSELIIAIRRIISGRAYVPSEFAGAIALSLNKNTKKASTHSLSDREFYVLCQLACGKTVQHIADELKISKKTVSTFKRRLMEKLDLASNAELVKYAIQTGLVV